MAIFLITGGSKQVFQPLDVKGDGTEHQRNRAALGEGVDAEAPQSGDPVGQVHLAGRLKALPLHVVHDLCRDLLGLLRTDPRCFRQRTKRAVDPVDRRQAGLEMDVGSSRFQAD